jgi:arsenite-transporting ATPase
LTIIFDTAPTGHTIRLLQLPGAWSSFIESNPDGASCLGPMAGLEKQREQYSHAVQALSDPDRTRLVLVARLQKSTLQEVARTHDELAAIGLKNQYLVINGVLPETKQSTIPWRLQYGAGSRRRWQVFPLVWTLSLLTHYSFNQ